LVELAVSVLVVMHRHRVDAVRQAVELDFGLAAVDLRRSAAERLLRRTGEAGRLVEYGHAGDAPVVAEVIDPDDNTADPGVRLGARAFESGKQGAGKGNAPQTRYEC